MIGATITYISKQINDHLRKVNRQEADGSTPPMAALIDGSQLDPLVLPLGTVSMLIVDINEDREFREGDRYQRRITTETSVRIESHYPDLHLELNLLFIAKFKDYARAWNQLTHVIGFFQQHPVFNAINDLDLPEGIGQLAASLAPQSLQQTHELWSALKIAPHPAVLYRLRLLTISGPMHGDQPKRIKTVDTKLKSQPIDKNLRSPPLAVNHSNA